MIKEKRVAKATEKKTKAKLILNCSCNQVKQTNKEMVIAKDLRNKAMKIKNI